MPVPVPVRLNRHRHPKSVPVPVTGTGTGFRFFHLSQTSIDLYDFIIFFSIANPLPFFLLAHFIDFKNWEYVCVHFFLDLSRPYFSSPQFLINYLKASTSIRSKYVECSVLFVTRIVSGFDFRSSSSKFQFNFCAEMHPEFENDIIIWYPQLF